MHLLIVEDDDRLRGLLKRMLEEERHVVDVAANGEEGLEIALGPNGIDIIVPSSSCLDATLGTRSCQLGHMTSQMSGPSAASSASTPASSPASLSMRW